MPRTNPFTTPVIDYEPAPEPLGRTPCPPPSPAALHRSTTRRPRPVRASANPEVPVPPAAAMAADAALRCALEVIDRRRPVAQLRPLLAASLVDTVVALARTSQTGAAVLRRVRLQRVGQVGPEPRAAEVFASYTRSGRVRAIAGRIELQRVNGSDRWKLVALQIG